MNRTQLLIASQPRPKRRVARPGASSLCFVPITASAVNDHHMGPASEPPEKPPTGDALRAAGDAFPTAEASPAMLALARERLAAVESGRSDKFSARSVSRFRRRLAGASGTSQSLSLLIESGPKKSTDGQRGAE
jgi:hypothetical protein